MKRRGKDQGPTADDAVDVPVDVPVALNARVRVYPETDSEVCGSVVEDFGDTAGHGVDIGENQFVAPARRWAVVLDSGGLVFVDSAELVVE